MKERIVLMFFFVLVSIVCFAAEPAKSADATDGWKLATERNGVTIYTRPHSGSPLKEFKAVGEIAAPSRAVCEVIEDVDAYPSFMPYMAECRLLRRESDSLLSYQRISPKICSDRDFTLRTYQSSWLPALCSRLTSFARGVVCVLLSHRPEFMKDRLRILTVEDEPAVAQMVGLLLGGPGAKITHACDGWMALMKIGAAKEPFDVIITDHRMPRMNGLDLVRRLRVRKFEGKIIVLSAHLTKENIQAYEELQVDMMFAKPFDCEELQLAMNLLTKNPSAPVTAPLA